MDVLISYQRQNSDERTTISLPLSKSVIARRLLLQALRGEEIAQPPVSACSDEACLREALRDIAAGERTINVGESGTAYRFLTAYLSFIGGEHLLTGSPTLLRRPITPLINALRSLGAFIVQTPEGLIISGGSLRGDRVCIDATESSQYVSSLMLIGSQLPNGLTIIPEGRRVSTSYITLTGAILAEYGVPVELTESSIIVGKDRGEVQKIKGEEKDWSSASYFFEVCALTGTALTLPGLLPGMQGDSRAIELFRPLGVIYKEGELRKVTVTPPATITVNMRDVPDLVPSYCATLCGLGIPFRLTGIGHLRHKESNRLESLRGNLHSLGFRVEQDGDGLFWEGETCPRLGRISSCGDHRIVMAMAPLAVISPITIHGAEDVAKSFPGYFEQLAKAGYLIETIEEKE